MPEWTVLRPQQAHVSCQVSKVLYNCHGTTQSLLYLWQCCTGDIYQSMADRCIAPLLEALQQGHLLQVFHLLGQLFSFASSAFHCKPIGIFKFTKCVSKAMLRDQICFLSIYIYIVVFDFLPHAAHSLFVGALQWLDRALEHFQCSSYWLSAMDLLHCSTE